MASGETITLREYIESRFASLQRAVDKAEESNEKRFAAVNEMRAMVADAALQYMPRAEFESQHRGIVEKVESLQKFLWVGLGAVLAIQLFVSIIFVFIKKGP